jgi:hypothetical protein
MNGNEQRISGRLVRQSAIDHLKQKTGADVVLSKAQIKDLCMKYRLRFLRSHKYSGVLDTVVASKMVTLMEKLGVPNLEWDARKKFFIMAPAKSFALSERPKPIDPVLFYRAGDDEYILVHKWGNDFTFVRRLIGAVTSTKFIWGLLGLFLGLAMIAAGCAVGHHFTVPCPDGRSGGCIEGQYVVIASLLYIIGFVCTIRRLVSWSDVDGASEDVWNEPYHGKLKLFYA